MTTPCIVEDVETDLFVPCNRYLYRYDGEGGRGNLYLDPLDLPYALELKNEVLGTHLSNLWACHLLHLSNVWRLQTLWRC